MVLPLSSLFSGSGSGTGAAQALKLEKLAITTPVSASKLAELRGHFKQVHYYPEARFVGQGYENVDAHAGEVPRDVAAEVEVWYANYLGIPKEFAYEDVGKTELVQLTSAGANFALKSPALSDPEAQKKIIISSASGIHSLSIPQWIVAQVINLYKSIHIQTYNLRTEQKWVKEVVNKAPARSLYGKTAGLLGYGHIGRETARLLKAFNVEIIAATSTGEKKADEGYIVPHTGDPDGSIPSAYYSTSDPASFKDFLKRSDILISSLPSTPQTQFLLNKDLFALLPKDAVFVNIGRGDLVHSEDILAALEQGSLSSAALDVTDPEPLPDNHPLYTHPRVTITPHTSGDIEGYFDAGADLLIENVRRIREGGKPINRVDPSKGY